MAKIEFTQGAINDILKRYDKGLGETTVQIGEVYECSYATIRKLLVEQNVFNPGLGPANKVHFNKDQQEFILTSHSNNISSNSIAKTLGLSDSVILRFLKEQGVDTSGYGRGERKGLIKDTSLWRTCRALTRAIYRRHKSEINPKCLKLSKHGFHIDHKLPISVGLLENLTVLDLAHPCNLQVLSANENLSKYTKSSIANRSLVNSIKEWNKLKGDPFSTMKMEVEYHYSYGRYRYFSGKYRECVS